MPNSKSSKIVQKMLKNPSKIEKYGKKRQKML
jgi:hypothetical protein